MATAGGCRRRWAGAPRRWRRRPRSTRPSRRRRTGGRREPTPAEPAGSAALPPGSGGLLHRKDLRAGRRPVQEAGLARREQLLADAAVERVRVRDVLDHPERLVLTRRLE